MTPVNCRKRNGMLTRGVISCIMCVLALPTGRYHLTWSIGSVSLGDLSFHPEGGASRARNAQIGMARSATITEAPNKAAQVQHYGGPRTVIYSKVYGIEEIEEFDIVISSLICVSHSVSALKVVRLEFIRQLPFRFRDDRTYQRVIIIQEP